MSSFGKTIIESNTDSILSCNCTHFPCHSTIVFSMQDICHMNLGLLPRVSCSSVVEHPKY